MGFRTTAGRAAATWLLIALAATAARAELAVTARDEGYVTTCAEMDNVVVTLESPEAARFEIRARHPAYAAAASQPSHAADFSNCDFPKEPIWDFEPESFVLHEDSRFRLQGHRLSKSWRPEEVSVSVGDRTWPVLHLLQLVVKTDGGEGSGGSDVQVLVLYPADGYWRAKPLPSAGRRDTPFGTSFLVGPVEVDRRPLVKLTGVRFDPVTLSFHLSFVRGGEGVVRVESADAEELRLGVALSDPVADLPFALLSSMHVAEDNADVGRIRNRPQGEVLWDRHPPVAFEAFQGAEFDFGRDVPSRHNTLAPDLVFGPFDPD